MADNKLYYGDNLDVLRRHVASDSVDLIYLDPPFNSDATYNVLFGSQDGTQAAAQIKAFEDTWTWDRSAAATYHETIERGGRVADALVAFRTLVGDSNMLAYLSMMAPRLVELRRVLKDTGSIYLHCDPTASHYLKLLLDAVLGPRSFRNEVIWHYRTFQGLVKTYYARKHDTLLFYTKGNHWTFNQLFDDDYKDTIDYKRWRNWLANGNQILGKNMPMQDTRFLRYYRRWKKEHGREPDVSDVVFKAKGQPVDTVWDMKAVDPKDKSRLGYPTQKPEDLMDRVILASSNPGDLVLDPFCGCGTTIASAQKLGRRWVGIDVTHLAVGLIKTRLSDAFGDKVEYDVIGEPTTVEDAARLAVEEPYQFQAWALGLVGARQGGPIKRGADKGIDGRLYFHDEGTGGKTKQVIISVKAGKVHRAHVHELGGVVVREGAAIGVLVSFNPPTKPMREEAASAGFYESPWGKHPRIQLLTVEQLLEGARIDYPATTGANVTFKRAPKAKTQGAEQLDLEKD